MPGPIKGLKVELAYPGVFGEDGTIVTADDLSGVAETFSGKVPITLGHTLADFMPAFGWVNGVNFDSKTQKLVGENIELSEALADAVEKGFFRNWSIGVRRRKADGKPYLHHLAILGAVPPKVKDLKVLDGPIVNMADDADTEMRWTFKLSDNTAFKLPLIGGILQRVRDYLIEKEGQEAADRIINVWEIDELKRIEETKSEDLYAADNTRKKEDTTMSGVQDKGKGGDSVELSDAKTMASNLEAALRNSRKDSIKAAAQGKVPADKMPLVMELADSLPVDESIELSDSDGKKRKTSPLDLLQEIFNAIPLPVKPGSVDMGDVRGGDGNDINYSTLIKNV